MSLQPKAIIIFKIIFPELCIAQVIMRLRVPRIAFQRGRKTIERFGCVSVLRFDNAEIAIGVGDAIMLLDRLGV